MKTDPDLYPDPSNSEQIAQEPSQRESLHPNLSSDQEAEVNSRSHQTSHQTGSQNLNASDELHSEMNSDAAPRPTWGEDVTIRAQESLENMPDSSQWRWWSQLVAVIIWVNLAIAIFDKAYPTLQGLYAQYLPSIADFYNPIHARGLQNIDKYFIALFGLDFLIRSLASSYRKQGVSWGDAMLRRWYDIFLLLPIWRWLRIIPALVRSHQSRLFNMTRILSQITHEPAAYLADRVSVFLLVRLINQTRDSVKSGEAAKLLFEPKQYVQVSKVNKAEAILDRLLKLSIYKVLPRVQPELEAVLHYNLGSAFKQSSFYQGILNIPGIDTLPGDVTEQLASYLAQFTYDTLATYYADTRGRQLLDQLTQDFKNALQEELRDEATRLELQSLLSDLLEELKMNYVQQSVDHNPEDTLEEADQLQQKMEESKAEKYAQEESERNDSDQPQLNGEKRNFSAQDQPLLESYSSSASDEKGQ